jgi:hypothetical protein
MLFSLPVSKFDQTSYLRHRKSGKSQAKLLDSFAEVVTADDGVGHDARSAYNWSARHLAGNALNQLALGPLNVRSYLYLRHLAALLYLAALVFLPRSSS